MNKRFYLLLAITIGVIGCSDSKEREHKKNAPPAYILYSPNGEPLNGGALGKPTCEKALTTWFVRMSGSETGTISKDMFITDARAQFQRMDIDKNGFLVSEELDRFRAPYRQEPEPEKPDTEKGKDGKDGQKGHGKKHGGGSGDKNPIITSAQLFDPVMSADANLDFRVTPNEFMAQAQDNFTKLDTNHDNQLGKDEILAGCNKDKEGKN